MDLMIQIILLISKLCTIKHIEADCSYNRLFEIQNHYKYNLRLTDKPLAELLEAILVSKVVAINWENKLILT